MRLMSMITLLKKQITEAGWLSLTNIFFDNAYTINVFATRGYVAFSEADECFFSYNAMDTTDTQIIENQYVTIGPGHAGMQQVITVVGLEHVQHFNIAQYSHYCWYTDEQDKTPYPKIPTVDTITSMTPNEETGLYDGCDVVVQKDGKERSTIDLYEHMVDYRKCDLYSGANVDAWKMFYNNHDKFIAMLSAAYGVTDAI